MDNSSTTSILTSLLGVALAASIIFGIWQYRESGSLFADKSSTEFIADSLSNVSSHLQTNVSALQNQLEDRNQEYEELQSKYEENNKLLSQKERTSRRYRGELSTLKAMEKEKAARLALLNQKIVELKTLNNSLEDQLQEIPELNSRLNASAITIKQQNEQFTALNSRFSDLDKEYKSVIYYSPADNFKVKTLKWNDRVTAKAKKSRAVQVSFKLPSYTKSESAGTKPVYLTITDKNSEPISGVLKNINVMGMQEPVALEVHAVQNIDFTQNPQYVVFSVRFDEKVQPGTYTAKVYTTDDYLGSVIFELRDSFLFF